MFNLLVTFDGQAWETDQLMKMKLDRFKEYSGTEAAAVDPGNASSLAILEAIPSLLVYETGSKGPNVDTVRYGTLHDIKLSGNDLSFYFTQEGKLPRDVVKKFASLLSLDDWEISRIHWAIKDGRIPTCVREEIQRTYDVVFSFAGENRDYVEKVAEILRSHHVNPFYDAFEQTYLWGKNLVEQLEYIYTESSSYCVIFVSKQYKDKMWTTHERRAAIERALKERKEYILPALFDSTKLPGLPSTVANVSLAEKTPSQFAKIILEKLGKH